MPVVGRAGSSSDGVNVPVPASPITVSSSDVSPISVHSSSSESKQRTRSSSRKGTRVETNAPEGPIRTRKARSDKGMPRGSRK